MILNQFSICYRIRYILKLWHYNPLYSGVDILHTGSFLLFGNILKTDFRLDKWKKVFKLHHNMNILLFTPRLNVASHWGWSFNNAPTNRHRYKGHVSTIYLPIKILVKIQIFFLKLPNMEQLVSVSCFRTVSTTYLKGW